MSEPVYIGCVPVADMHGDPARGSEIRWCHVCACEVWISLEGLALPNGTITCLPCLDGLSQAITMDHRELPGMRDALKREGWTDAEVDHLGRIVRSEHPLK